MILPTPYSPFVFRVPLPSGYGVYPNDTTTNESCQKKRVGKVKPTPSFLGNFSYCDGEGKNGHFLFVTDPPNLLYTYMCVYFLILKYKTNDK